MIALTIQANHPEGYPVRIWDYLVSVPAAVFKIEQFAAAGLVDKFKAGRLLADDCVGKKLRAKIEIEAGRDNYSDRNSRSRSMWPQVFPNHQNSHSTLGGEHTKAHS